MGPAAPQPTLNHLRQTLAGIDPSLGPALAGRGTARSALGPAIDAALGGGLACGALHELAPAAPLPSRRRQWICLGARGACRAASARRGALDRHRFRGGRGRRTLRPRPRPVRPGLGAASGAARAEAGRCALGDGGGAALPRARLRHRRTDRRGRGGRSHRDAPACARRARRRQRPQLRLRPAHPPPRHRSMPSAAATRWQIAAGARAGPTPTAALGRARFDLSLRKNRRGPSGRWIIEWDHHERAFQPAVSVGVAAAALDRPDRAPLVRAG